MTITITKRGYWCLRVVYTSCQGLESDGRNFLAAIVRVSFKFKLSNVTIGDNFKSQCFKRDLQNSLFRIVNMTTLRKLLIIKKKKTLGNTTHNFFLEYFQSLRAKK
jgi:hypothetical protein